MNAIDFAQIDFTPYLAIGGFLIASATGIVQIVNIYRNTKRIPSQIKLDESNYAKNAIEAANLATEARLKLEAHTLELEERIGKLQTAIEGLEAEVEVLETKNKKLVLVVDELFSGVSILLEQFKLLEISPSWVPSEALKETIKARQAKKEAKNAIQSR